jgi:hypothetical protein
MDEARYLAIWQASLAKPLPQKKKTGVPRKWDLEEAKLLRARDKKFWTFRRLGDHYGVSAPAVYQAFYPVKIIRVSSRKPDERVVANGVTSAVAAE